MILVLFFYYLFYFLYFRELLLNNNFLRVLPYEIGKLFHLHVLGLGGNPLQKEFLQIYNEPNGTQKLLTYMLDNLSSEYIALKIFNIKFFFIYFY